MAAYMSPDLLERYLFHILNPVYRILDDDTIHDKDMGALVFFRVVEYTV